MIRRADTALRVWRRQATDDVHEFDVTSVEVVKPLGIVRGDFEGLDEPAKCLRLEVLPAQRSTYPVLQLARKIGVDPEERSRVTASCVLDYETALLFLDTALTLSARCVAAATSTSYSDWIKLVRAAERGDEGLPLAARRQILYLQRTVLFARNKGVAHPLELVS